jgi:hypothetical protein
MAFDPITDLYKDTLEILKREVKHLRNLSIGAKLPASQARDLVSYVKLLSDMKDAQARIKKEQAEAAAKPTVNQTDATLAAIVQSVKSIP